MYRFRNVVRKHPAIASILSVFAFILFAFILTRLPTWVFFSFLMAGFVYVGYLEYAYKKQKKIFKNLTQDDFKALYAEYEALVEEQVRLQNNDRAYIMENWLNDFHDIFYAAASMFYQTKLTDFHIAACMIFAIVHQNHPLSHTRFAYDCVRSLLSKPKVYLCHVAMSGMITLEVERNLKEADLSIMENSLPLDEICKIIKEGYIQVKTPQTLIELANFLERLYLRCF